MKNGFERSVGVLKKLEGMVLKDLSSIEFLLDSSCHEKYAFVYSLCCYLSFSDSTLLKITSIESEEGYTLYVSSIDQEEYDFRFESLSENMKAHVEIYNENLVIENVDFNFDGGDVLSLNMRLAGEKEIHFVCGEHYRNSDGTYSVSASDEMVLMFKRKEDAVALGLP